jgi:hypothetical protein
LAIPVLVLWRSRAGDFSPEFGPFSAALKKTFAKSPEAAITELAWKGATPRSSTQDGVITLRELVEYVRSRVTGNRRPW